VPCPVEAPRSTGEPRDRKEHCVPGAWAGTLYAVSSPRRDTRTIIEAYVEAHRSGDVSRLGEIIASEFHYRNGPAVGVEGVATGVRALHAGFSQIACSLDQCVCEGEWAAFRFVLSGIHSGVFAGRAPTGRRLTWSGADFVRVRDDRLVELWPVQESLPLLEGLGAVVRVNPAG
jgi:predicted ester cyclase